ncbi:haloalkane dehalogenase 2 [Mycolicibacterium phocaicum]|uniref:Alpha/beta hydrolase n=1 Tax=Mycolicibacterium phocaicum TaxID=319706 RepID=A0A7I7ZSP9_9MYCO|nr:alpha/beta hydrolase [Mycolicibacterium phocaicum]BBZ56832.1 haloalkane dehalogenase 2 [Mycolicibacterium phocaicum]
MADDSAVGVRPNWVGDELFPFQSRFVELDGHVIHYVDEGSGPVLLMLHGNPTWSFMYRQVIMSLRDRFRCIAFDHPGFGLSTAAAGYGHMPDDHAAVAVAFLDHLGLSDLTLLLHDWGGPIGLRAAEQRPELFSRLVIANTWGWPLNGDFRVELAARLIGGPVGRELTRRSHHALSMMMQAGHRRRRLSPEELTHYCNALPSARRRQAAAVLPEAIIGRRDFFATVERNLIVLEHLPVLIIWADADVALGDKERRRWESTFPDHSTVVLHGAGHFVPSDAPDEYSAAVAGWYNAPRP